MCDMMEVREPVFRVSIPIYQMRQADMCMFCYSMGGHGSEYYIDDGRRQ